MPQIALSAASYAAAAAPAVAATAAKATVMASLKSVALSTITNLAFSAAMSALNPQVGAGGRTDEWVLSPDGPIPFAAGRIGVPGSVVYRKTYGPDLMYYGIPSVLSGSGPIDGFEGFLADDETVTFDGSGKAISSQYTGELWYRNRLGAQPDTALPSPSGLKGGATLPGWTSAHRLSGKASYLIVMGENSKGTAFPTGEIKPIITVRGLKGWDPRQDSTYPGGSGSCRLHDPSTWVYITNPILWALKWTLGLWEGPTGKGAPQVDFQVGGIGAKLSGIDVPAFVSAANVADANGWTVAAHPNTDDDKSQVLDAFLQAGGAIYAQRAGKISCIQRAAPRTSIVTISARDTAGPLEIDTAASRIDRINTIRPRFWSEAHRWQLTAIDEVTAASYRMEDGAIRTRGIDFPYVTSAVQAAQLAALQIANTREGIIGVVPLKPHLQRIKPGDAFTITEAGFVLNGLKCLCLNTDYDPATGIVRVSFVSETDGKYPFAMGQDPTPPAPPVLTPVDPTFVSPPEAGDWTITPRPPAAGGGQLPGFDLGGVVSNDTATAIIVEYGPSATGPWKQAYQGPPTVTNIPIDGLQPGATYYVAIQYQRNQNYSAREVFGPYTAPLLDPSPNAPTIVGLQDQITTAFGDIFDVSGLLADARADIDAQGVEIAAARGPEPTLNARIVSVDQARIDGDAASAEAISLVQARTSNTEADIIDLENAQAAETSARAEQVSEINARIRQGSPNLLPGGDFYSLQGWYYPSGAWQAANSPTVGRYAYCSGAGEGFRDITGDFGGKAYSLSAELDPTGRCYLQFWSADYAAFLGGSPFLTTTESFKRVSTAPTVAPAGAAIIRVVKESFGPEFGIARVAVQNGPATDWRDDETVAQMGASVTEQSLAIVDLENQQAIASWYKVADATGGKPTRIGLQSSAFGNFIALDAEQVYFGENTVIDTASQTQQGVFGSSRRVIANGPPFGPDNLIQWVGPSSVALGSMTKANAGFWVDQTGAYGPTPTPLFWARATPPSITKTRMGAGPISTAVNDVVVSCYTGIVGATCTWTRVSGDPTIGFPSTGFAPTFNASLALGETKSAVFAGLVTKGGEVALVYVNVEFQENT